MPCRRKREIPLIIGGEEIKSCHKCLMFRWFMKLEGKVSPRVPPCSFPGCPFCSFQLYTLFAPAFRVRDKQGQCHLRAAGDALILKEL